MKKMYKMFILIFLFSNALIAQNGIQYYNLSNHPMYRPNSFDIDMLKDALPYDFSINLDYADTGAETGYVVKITPQQALRDVMVVNDTLVKALNFGDVINGNSTTWANNSMDYMYLCYAGATTVGQWSNVANKYIGVKMFKNGDTLYGWIQMTILPGTQPTVIVHDMAYQKISDKGLTAGQTVGIKDENHDFAKFILSNSILQVQTDRPVNVSISDISGHLINSAVLKSDKAIDLSSWAKGVYILRIESEEGVMSKKIVLQ